MAGKRGILGNPLVPAGLAGMLVWLAGQPTVPGYKPLLAMFWDPGVRNLPLHDALVLLLSWLATMLFCHFLLFTVHRLRRRGHPDAG
jgi:hypothetical protein